MGYTNERQPHYFLKYFTGERAVGRPLTEAERARIYGLEALVIPTPSRGSDKTLDLKKDSQNQQK